MNVQMAVKAPTLRDRGEPRASRTVPFVSKATGPSLRKLQRAAWQVKA